eukprot:jgi/Hompol1/4882/HPOL_004022-RA
MYRALVAAGSKGHLRFTLRYKPAKNTRKSVDASVSLSGYGVELAIKSTEYKVEDDRSIKVTETSGEKLADESADSDRDQEQSLYQAVPIIKTLKKEQIQEIDHKAASYIAQSSSPIDALARVSQDFPKYAHMIEQLPVNESVVSTAQMLRHFTTETNLLLLNGIPIDIPSFSAFKLLRVMRKETKLVKSLQQISWTAHEAIELLAAQLSTSSGPNWGECFDVRSKTVFWINDVERDSRYSRFPSQISEILRPSYPGQLKYIRKNLLSAVFLMDLSKSSHVRVVSSAFQYIENSLPLRFGISALVDVENHESPATVAALAAYWIIENKKSKFQAFFEELSEFTKTSTEPIIPAEQIRLAFHRATGKNYANVYANSQINSDDQIMFLHDFADRLGVSLDDGAVFANGRFLALNQ